MWRKYFLFVFSLFFIAGNLTTASVSDTVTDHNSFYTLLIICDISFIAFSIFIRTRFRHFALIIAFCLGQLGFCTSELSRSDNSRYFHADGTIYIKGIISDIGISSSGKPFAEISLKTEKTILYAIPSTIQLSVGDTLSATVSAEKVKNFTPDFNYVQHMARRNIFYTCIPARGKNIVLQRPKDIHIKLYPAVWRQRFSEKINNTFPDEKYSEARSVIKALSYGYQDEVPNEILNAFRRSGAMHLLALSGMHLVMIYGILAFLLSLICRNPTAKKTQSVLLLIILWTYTVFTGCGVSILRAMLMVSVYEAGSLLNRRKHQLNSLSISAIIITSANPYAPVSLSFMLSYSAMTAIFLLHPVLIETFHYKNKFLRNIAESCSITISCQFLTAPIIYMHFGTFANFSLVVNILCSPITSIGMILTPLSLLTTDLPFMDFTRQALVSIIGLLIYINEIIASI